MVGGKRFRRASRYGEKVPRCRGSGEPFYSIPIGPPHRIERGIARTSELFPHLHRGVWPYKQLPCQKVALIAIDSHYAGKPRQALRCAKSLCRWNKRIGRIRPAIWGIIPNVGDARGPLGTVCSASYWRVPALSVFAGRWTPPPAQRPVTHDSGVEALRIAFLQVART